MINRGLVPYIQSYLKQGANRSLIVQYLAAYGYSRKDIEDTYDFLSKSESRPFPVLIIVLALCALVLIGSAVYFLTKPPEARFSFTASLPEEKFIGGRDILLSYSLQAVGMKENRESVIFETVRDNAGDVVYQSNEVLLSAKVDTKTIRLSEDKLPPGDYTLKLKVTNGKSSFERDLPFSVLAERDPCANGLRDVSEEGVDCGGFCKPCSVMTPSPTAVSCDFDCDDENPCTRDSCDSRLNQCMHEQIIPCCKNEVCESTESKETCPEDCSGVLPSELTPFQVIERAALLASDDLEKAAQLCRTLEEFDDKNACFDRIAHVVQKSSVCDLVEGDLQSACYMDFAMKGDYSVCEKITNKYLRDACDNLEQLQASL